MLIITLIIISHLSKWKCTQWTPIYHVIFNTSDNKRPKDSPPYQADLMYYLPSLRKLRLTLLDHLPYPRNLDHFLFQSNSSFNNLSILFFFQPFITSFNLLYLRPTCHTLVVVNCKLSLLVFCIILTKNIYISFSNLFIDSKHVIISFLPIMHLLNFFLSRTCVSEIAFLSIIVCTWCDTLHAELLDLFHTLNNLLLSSATEATFLFYQYITFV